MTLNIASYGSTRTACEFLTGIAYAMEVSGGLNQEMSERGRSFVPPGGAGQTDLQATAGRCRPSRRGSRGSRRAA